MYQEGKCAPLCEDLLGDKCKKTVGCKWAEEEGFGWCETDPDDKRIPAPVVAKVESESKTEAQLAAAQLATMKCKTTQADFCKESKSFKTRTCNLNGADTKTVICELGGGAMVKALGHDCKEHTVLAYTCHAN
jgi:hypothetical protein